MTTTMVSSAGAATGGPSYRILLIEDDPGDALLVEELLHDTGLRFELTTCATLADASSTLSSGVTDCILLDLHLPDASGTSAVTAAARTDRGPPTGRPRRAHRPARHADHTLNAGRHTDDLAVLRLDWGTHRHGHPAAEQRLG